MQDLVERLQTIQKKLLALQEHLDLAKKQEEITRLESRTEDIHLWDDPAEAQKVMKRLSALRDEVEQWNTLNQRIHDALELAQLDDESIRSELEQESTHLEDTIARLEIQILLGGKYDRGNALLSINAGAGGTDSQDWAAMLQRMYLRWCERRGYQTEILDLTEGEEAGIKSVTIAVNGPYAYGYLKAEKGVHRLVRLSPFDAAHRRHTSFAQVEVLPELEDDDTAIQINPDDLRIDIYRSSSAGGQNVQKNATAVRITHLPTGIVVSCQNERSQMQNRENAMRVLRAKLAELQREAQERQMAELRGEYIKAEWGSQIRSYVLHPYQMVKDHRTDFETGNTQAVLDGEIDGFIEAYLRSSIRSET
ncbi:peptide chain release factor 2 [Anaerolinea thermolimosa]|uniref:peptide chain release factor 2 n=1 Tax=Anaerolinea thermolimosa TaxID=229919 RepID=UPI000E08DF19|nr:peptide chain release factor 2 [Anaerolinea thermolimosa]